MSTPKEKEFAVGMFFKESPLDFINFTVSLNRKKVVDWLNGKEDEWVNIDVKTSRNGTVYGEVNNYQGNNKQKTYTPKEAVEKVKNDFDNEEDIPF